MRTEQNKATEEVESTASEQTRQETDLAALQQCPGVKAGIWTERMLAALGNGVKSGKWHNGQMPTSQAWDFSPSWKPTRKRADPDEETIDWRFGGRGEPETALLYPYRAHG